MKVTKQKEAILLAVNTMKYHPTADEIYNQLRHEFPSISLGTVYRNLHAFVEKGRIAKIAVPGKGDRFDYCLDTHHHLFCSKCGRVFDAKADVNIPMQEGVGSITGYSLILYGECVNCQKVN